MRTLVDIPDDDLRWLDSIAEAEGKSRAAVVREAVAHFRHQQDKVEMERYLGLWERHGSTVDGLAYERALRSEWPSIEEQERGSRSDAA